MIVNPPGTLKEPLRNSIGGLPLRLGPTWESDHGSDGGSSIPRLLNRLVCRLVQAGDGPPRLLHAPCAIGGMIGGERSRYNAYM